MTYNSIISLRGINKQLIVSYSYAIEIQKIFNNKEITSDYPITIGKQSFRKGDIKYIEIINDGDDSRKWEESNKEFYAQEKIEYERLIKTTAEYRGGLLDIFSYLYKFSSGNFPSEETLRKANEIQTEFFKKNPKRRLCDLYLLKSLIPMNNTKPNSFEHGYFRIVEKAVFRDMQLSGQLKSKYEPKELITTKNNETVQEMKWRAEDNRKIDDDLNGFVSEAVKNF